LTLGAMRGKKWLDNRYVKGGRGRKRERRKTYLSGKIKLAFTDREKGGASG